MSSHNPTLHPSEKYSFGSQYRSVIFYHNEEQKVAGETILRNLQAHYKETIGTELLPVEAFYVAEEYHQKYYDSNRDAPFCKAIIDPKLSKLRKKHPKVWKHSRMMSEKKTATLADLR